MKILVVDDKQENQMAAKAQLKGHDLTVLPSFNEADELLGGDVEFDLVMFDLMVPPHEHWKNFGKPEPLGVFLLLHALLKSKAQYICVFTDTNHHGYPAGAAVDTFNNCMEYNPTVYMVGGTKVALVNNRNWVKHFLPDDLTESVDYDVYSQTETIQAKDWRTILALLVEGKKGEDIE